MPAYESLFTGKYLASADLGTSEPTVKIARVVPEMVEGGEDEKTKKTQKDRKRWIAYFDGKEKGMLLNRTNCILLAALAKSNKTEDWAGHSITLGARDVKLGGETVKGLRIIGSPELSAPLSVTVKLPKKKPRDERLMPTGRTAARAQAGQPDPERGKEQQAHPADPGLGWGNTGTGAPEPAATPRERVPGEDDA